MRLSFRFFLMYFVLLALMGYFVLDVFVSEIKPSVRRATEQGLVSTANLLAQTAKADFISGNIKDGQLATMFAKVNPVRDPAEFNKEIYQQVQYRVYVTDKKGIVLFDSENIAVGQDYSRWNDVYLTLRGKYGARSTRSDPNDPSTSVMYVAAPIYINNQIQGVLTVSQDNMVMNPIVFRSEQQILHAGVILLVLSLGLGLGMVWWLNGSIQKLVRYAQNVTKGEAVTVPSVGSKELMVLAGALGEMRSKLDGKAYVEEYVHTLTHELKSPLAAIKSAGELLEEDPPLAYRTQFSQSIVAQSLRMQEMIDRMLLLVRLESAPALNLTEHPVEALLQDVIALSEIKAGSVGVTFQAALEPAVIQMDKFWFQQAIQNVLDNALAFSPKNGVITVKGCLKDGVYEIAVQDEGAGIPEFALDKIFDRFYSLARPNAPKSSGIGLNLVRQIMTLHQGRISVENRSDKSGVCVRLIFPIS